MVFQKPLLQRYLQVATLEDFLKRKAEKLIRVEAPRGNTKSEPEASGINYFTWTTLSSYFDPILQLKVAKQCSVKNNPVLC